MTRRLCFITRKKPKFGNKRSHAMNATKRKFSINLKNHKFWIPCEKKFIKLKITTQGIRNLDKKGIEHFLKTKNSNK